MEQARMDIYVRMRRERGVSMGTSAEAFRA